MRKLTVLLLSIFFVPTLFAQDVKSLISEGIALHDKGEYEAATAKYDEALRVDPSNHVAMYEKAHTLISLKKFRDAAELLKVVLKDSREPDYRRLSYVSYGTALDYMGEPKKAVEAYEKGIKEFPNSYLLYFNLGVTYYGLNENQKAKDCFQQSVSLNPFHASSHNILARLEFEQNRIPAVLACFSFLLMESQGNRAKENLALLKQLLYRGVTKGENGNVTISIPSSSLDKKKGKMDDFGTAEFMLSLMASDASIPDSIGAKNDADRLSYKMQMLISVISETDKKDKGFFKNFYVPMMVEMKSRNLVQTASYIAMSTAGDADISKWLSDNETAVAEFYDWLKSYKWSK